MEIARHWRLKAQRYRLEGSLCPNCGQPIFPPRRVCPACAAQTAAMAGERLAAFPASIDISDFESRISQQIMESMTG